jgi:ParB-like chromosome segregation protein Spo0J
MAKNTATEVHAPGTIVKVAPSTPRIVGGAILPDAEKGPNDTEMPAQDHPLYDERLTQPLDAGLAASIKVDGVDEMPQVFYPKGDKSGIPTVLNGRQRFRAARVGKLKEISVLVVDEPANIRLSMMRRNIHVADPIHVKIASAKRALAAGDAKKDVARSKGVTVDTLNSWLSFDTKAIQPVKDAVTAGSISFKMGWYISQKPTNEEQKRAYEALTKLFDRLSKETDDEGKPKTPTTEEQKDAVDKGAAGEDVRPTFTGKKELENLSNIAEAICMSDGVAVPSEGVGELEWWTGVRDVLRVIRGMEGNDGTEAIFDAMQEAADAAKAAKEAAEVAKVEAKQKAKAEADAKAAEAKATK